MGILDTFKAVFNGKKEELNQAMIEANPEAVLDQAINNAKAEYRNDEDRLGKLQALHDDQEALVKQKKENLIKIRDNISIAQRQGALEDVKFGTELYKQRESEAEELMENLKEIKLALDEVTNHMKSRHAEINKLESEKTMILAKLASAKTKEEVMNIRSAVSTGTSAAGSFSAAKDALNKKIGAVNGREKVQSKIGGTSSGGRFGGL